MTDTPIVKAQKDRSPSFPFIALGTAIERLQAFDATFGRHPTPANKAGMAWKLKEGSSQAFQTLAALKSFGLLDYNGSGPDRLAFITDDGRTYLRAQQDTVKHALLKGFALKPKAMQKFWGKWGADRPPNPICLDELVLKNGYTESAAETFLRVYDSTIQFAGLQNADATDSDPSEIQDSYQAIEIGDLIQWESNGTLRLEAPSRVRAVQEHGDQTWLFIEGSETAIPASEAVLERKMDAGPTPVSPMQQPLPPARSYDRTSPAGSRRPGMQADMFSLDEGVVTIEFPEGLTSESVNDLEDFFALFIKKARRRAGGDS